MPHTSHTPGGASLTTFLTLKIFINLENLYYFPSCGGGPISLLHSFTPSLPVRHLETRGAGQLSM